MADTNGAKENALNELEAKIIEQVEYYFGDFNLARDKFLQSEVRKNDGWVSLEVLITFNRMKKLSTDFKVILNALKKSDSKLLDFHDDENKIRRSLLKPIPEYNKERRDDLKTRSIYAKGFQLDMTLDVLKDFFKNYGPVEYIQMRKNAEKIFKGSVFAIFKTSEDAEKFIKDDTKYGDSELIRIYRDDYFKKKHEERQKHREEEKKKIKNDLEVKKEDEKKASLQKIVKGAILHMTGFSDSATREAIREVFDNFAPIAWVDFNKGDEEAWLRFDGEGLASQALTKAKAARDDKIEICGVEISCNVLSGDEELEQWYKIFEKQAERREKFKKGKRQYGKDKHGPKGKRRRFDSQVNDNIEKEIKHEVDAKQDAAQEKTDIPVIKNDSVEMKTEVM